MCVPADTAAPSAVWGWGGQRLASLCVALACLGLQLQYRVLFEPDEEFLAGDCGIGMLTSRGYTQQLNNGAALNAAYVAGGNGFLPAALTDEVASAYYLRSDNE